MAFRLVCIVGPRMSGKSTLAKELKSISAERIIFDEVPLDRTFLEKIYFHRHYNYAVVLICRQLPKDPILISCIDTVYIYKDLAETVEKVLKWPGFKFHSREGDFKRFELE